MINKLYEDFTKVYKLEEVQEDGSIITIAQEDEADKIITLMALRSQKHYIFSISYKTEYKGKGGRIIRELTRDSK